MMTARMFRNTLFALSLTGLLAAPLAAAARAPRRILKTSQPGVFRDHKEHATHRKFVAVKIRSVRGRIEKLAPSKAFARELQRFGTRSTKWAASKRPYQEARENRSMISLGHNLKDRGTAETVLRVRKTTPGQANWDAALSKVLDHPGKRWNVRAIKKMPNGNVLEVYHSVDIGKKKYYRGYYSVHDAKGRMLVKRGSFEQLERSVERSYGTGKRTENRVKRLLGISPATLSGLLNKVHPVRPQISARMFSGSHEGVLQRPLPEYFQAAGRQ